MRATATAHPNIAVIKYWGKRDLPLNLPAVPSLSVTLDRFTSVTTVTWGIDGPVDHIEMNGGPASAKEAAKLSAFLDRLDPRRPRARVVTSNNFPTAAGLASSASGFAALALAANAASGAGLSASALSVLARQGSGSATRSLWGGWVEWAVGEAADGSDSHGIPVAPADHWDLRVVVAIVGAGPKDTGSTEGMIRTQRTSPLYAGFVQSAAEDLAAAREALLRRDLATLGERMEHSTLKMVGTMTSARPPIRYWRPASMAAMDAVLALRAQGVGAWATSDAGPNVKVLCAAADAERVAEALRAVVTEVVVLGVGGDPTVELG
jgi:diphosphomevalonate decarboxylase